MTVNYEPDAYFVVMVPKGEITQETIDALAPLMSDDMRRNVNEICRSNDPVKVFQIILELIGERSLGRMLLRKVNEDEE